MAYGDPLKANLLLLWSKLITHSLAEFQYSASLAGIHSDVAAMEGGIQVGLGSAPITASKIYTSLLKFSKNFPISD